MQKYKLFPLRTALAQFDRYLTQTTYTINGQEHKQTERGM